MVSIVFALERLTGPDPSSAPGMLYLIPRQKLYLEYTQNGDSKNSRVAGPPCKNCRLLHALEAFRLSVSTQLFDSDRDSGATDVGAPAGSPLLAYRPLSTQRPKTRPIKLRDFRLLAGLQPTHWPTVQSFSNTNCNLTQTQPCDPASYIKAGRGAGQRD